MLDAIANKAPGIVLNLRNNGGGDDNITSCFAGWFVDKPLFYEYATKYDPGSRQFAIISEAWTQPRPDGYHGPVVVLVNPYTISSGEGLPLVFVKSGTGTIISSYGTGGALVMNSPHAIMPLDQILFFSDGSSLDKDRIIKVDSNSSLMRGIVPQVRVLVNEHSVAWSICR